MDAIVRHRQERANELSREYHERRRRQTPPWADLQAIREVYRQARQQTAAEGIPYDVDHVYPLRSDWVSGLHVVENLAVIPASHNRRKGNRRTTPPPRARRPGGYDG